MTLRLFCLGLALCLATSAATAQTPRAAPPPAAPNDELVGPIKLPDADLDTVLGLLEIYTGRSILRPQQLPTATYHLVIDRRLPKSEAVLALETVLALNQVGVAPLGDKFLKVVALAQVKTEAPEMITGSTLDLPPSGRVATKLFQFEFLRVNEFIPQIGPILTPGIANGVVPLEKANAALITDTISNLQRVETLIDELDKPDMTGLTPKFYTLHNGAKASDIVTKLRAMFQGPLQSQLGTAVSYSADDRSNQIILLADRRQIPLFDELIAKFDVKADPNTRNEVIYLKHASAKDVAPLLSQLVSGQTNAAEKASGGTGNRTTPVLQVNQPGAAGAGANLGEANNEFSNLVTILADDRSNSLVVSGTIDDLRLLHGLVDKLDVLLAQVSIQVVIVEVALDNSTANGLSSLDATIGKNALNGKTQITNFDVSPAGWALTGGTINPLAFQTVMGNVGSKTNSRVLVANTIITTHNKEADFVVSQQQPIITGTTTYATATTTTANGLPPTSSQVTYKDIGIEVKVTPLIGDDGSIQLKIDEKVDDAAPSTVTIDQNVQPIINHREATSFINVQDGQMVVLSGLTQTTNQAQRNKLGFLFEIPILSNLLGGRTNDAKRTELLLFVRPHVIPPSAETADANKQINTLSNKKDVDQFLKDPGKITEPTLLDKYYK